MLEGLADSPCPVPRLEGTPGELVAGLSESVPVPRAPHLPGVDAVAELEPRRVHGVDLLQRVPELVHLRAVPHRPAAAAAARLQSAARPPPVSAAERGRLRPLGAALVVLEGVEVLLLRAPVSSEPGRGPPGGRGAGGGGAGRVLCRAEGILEKKECGCNESSVCHKTH